MSPLRRCDVPISRRTALRVLGAGAAAAALPLGCAGGPESPAERRGGLALEAVSPIDRTLGEVGPRRFSGDVPDRTHRLLWDKAGYLASRGGALPEPDERVPLVVVGGGLSGLFSAWRLRQHRPVVLERAARFGGNARGESWGGLDYSIGAAYFMEPEAGTELAGLLAELGVEELWRKKTVEDPVVLGDRRFYRFWEGQTAPGHEQQFRALHRHLRAVWRDEPGCTYPELPARSDESRARALELDRLTFKQHLEQVAGGPLHPHIETALEHFCWSSFGGPFQEVSAAAGLNFYAGEFGALLVAPGGNSAVAERVLQRLAAELPAGHLRPESIVFDVRVEAGGVRVSYEDARGAVRCIEARTVIMACPKFAVARMLEGIEPERLERIRRLRYHSYLVANVLLRGGVADDFYDLYLIGEGAVDPRDIAGSSERQQVTDVVHGTFARLDPQRSILTLYRGLPYPGGRGQVYSDGAYERYRAEFERQIEGQILKLVGKTPADVVDVRVARWGHPLPFAAAGLFADGTIDAIQRPFRERVFFVEQDNWMLPAFETAAYEALYWAPQVDALLQRKA